MKLNTITISQVLRRGKKRVLSYNGTLIISDHMGQEYILEEPCRVDAIVIFVCMRGTLEYMVNLEPHVLKGPGILVNMPENILQFKSSHDLEAYVILFSPSMLDSMSNELRQMANRFFPAKKHFTANVPLELMEPLIPYYSLMKAHLSHIIPETDVIVSSLFQAFVFSILSVMHQHQQVITDSDEKASRGSRMLYDRFMDLLNTHHQQERSVSFYADQLGISAKYLSMAIKEYSGKNPSDWINEYVIAEAKSLLHYSQLSVQEVATHLNFPSQSAFGKYFKQSTGVSPIQYNKKRSK